VRQTSLLSAATKWLWPAELQQNHNGADRMHEHGGSKAEFYRDLISQLNGLMHGEPDAIANAANTAALLYQALPKLNWAGFYFLRGSELVLGPFQGKPACVRIAVGRGVCGAAVERAASVRVDDVHEFPGHIACDEASQSELVVPLMRVGRVIGVIDLDSPVTARFDAVDQAGIEAVAAAYVAASPFA
jgi:L-methionine (R)-S-oxide reductase